MQIAAVTPAAPTPQAIVAPLHRRPGQRRKASDGEVAALCEALGISIILTTQQRQDNETAARNTLAHVLAEYGQEHTVLVLRTIIKSEGNAKALTAPIIYAVSALARANPAWTATGLRWIEAFDTIPLLARFEAVKQLKRSARAPGWSYLAGMLTVELRDTFADLHKPSRTIAEIRAQREERQRVAAEAARDAAERRHAATVKSNGEKFAMGLRMAEIKKSTRCNREFGYAVRGRLGYLAGQSSMMRVAKRYSGRPELWHCSWKVLVELCSLALSEADRKQFEAAIAAGEWVTARAVRAARTAPHRSVDARPRDWERPGS